MGTVGRASCRWGGRREGRDSERRRQGRALINHGRYVYRLPQRLTTVIMQGMDMFNGEQEIQETTGLAGAVRIQCRSSRPASVEGRPIEGDAQTSQAEWSQPKQGPSPPPLAGCSGAPDQTVG